MYENPNHNDKIVMGQSYIDNGETRSLYQNGPWGPFKQNDALFSIFGIYIFQQSHKNKT